MNEQEILDTLAVKIYEPPLSRFRASGAIRDLQNPLNVLMLIIDFETEVSMGGMVTFLSNSSGRFAEETAEALDIIGRASDAALLRRISRIASEAGMTYEAVQAELVGVEPFTVTSFAELHGQKWDVACEKIHALGDKIDFEQMYEYAKQFIAAHKKAFEAVLHQARAQQLTPADARERGENSR